MSHAVSDTLAYVILKESGSIGTTEESGAWVGADRSLQAAALMPALKATQGTFPHLARPVAEFSSWWTALPNDGPEQ